MWKATLKNLWARKIRLTMSMLAIVLGVSFVAGSLVFSDMLKGSFNEIVSGSISDVDVSKKRDEVVADGSATSSKLTPEVIEKVKAVDGVKDASGTVASTDVYLIDTKGKALVSFGPPAFGFNWKPLPALGGKEGARLVEGRAPAKDDEVMVDPVSLKKSGHSIGDRVKVITPTAGTIEVTLVGTGTWGQGGSAGATYVFFTTPRAQQLFLEGSNTFSGIWVVTDTDADRKEVAKKVQTVLPQGYEARDGQEIADETSSAIGKALGFLDIFLLVFAGISLLVATFLILNTFTILVAQRAKELALFRAMGASRSQVRNTVLVEALVVGAIGSAIGVLGGVLLAFGIKGAMQLGGWDIGDAPIVVTPRVVVVAMVTGIVVTLVAALVPARRATRIAPIQAMTQAKTETEKGLGVRATIGTVMAVAGAALILVGLFLAVPKPAIWSGTGMAVTMIGVAIASPMLGRPVVWLVGKLYRAVFGEVGKLAELNSVRQPRRTAATASALMVGLTLVSMMAVFGASATASVTRQITDTVRGDYMVGQQGFKGFSSQARERIEEVDSVESVHALKIATVLKIEKGKDMPAPEALNDMTGRHWSSLGAMDADSLDKIVAQKIVKGRMFTGKNELIYDKEVAEHDKVDVGSTVSFFSPESQRKITLTVVGLYDRGDAQSIMDKWVSTETLTDTGLGQQDAFLTIYLKDGVDKQAARADLDKALEDMPLISVMDMGEYTDQMLAQVNQTMMMLYALLALSVIIAILGIVNTLGLSIVERTRELGLLRAIALTRSQVRRMITLESVVISLLGAVVGVGLGTAFGIVLQRMMQNQGIDRLGIPWEQLVAFLVAAVVVGILAALWPAHRAARTNILKAIAAE